MRKGVRVVAKRDEEKYPSRGSWPQYRGKKGTVTGTNLGEIGVSFTNDDTTDAWFQPHELERIK
ncbi:hypothetical protein SEA_STROSAHL_57 [Gordonia phage Strosahl]|uniref:Uncharacterized protein n=5 Tax=Soupsvirus TaxID=1982562 RepID=A0A160DGQ5_9CAUD|nr:hypothetical protein BEN61_gp055 [Gordonia phage Rosalind]YP_009269078.1 hypothetical protein BEN62_gp052 [Gordonia phage KatherineG]YP_009269356.1 hypothetical protein BEN59_gp053 [Gordonia phage Soups]YP_009281668.1 hypothetical protein BIZ67_gp053 [Gordonia phage Remus]YP_009285997.1 hypothetical protein BIZ70_gp057 [Gordonia phage JSwag]YP_009596258.1 hypothetical protein FDH03_gp053 [Gordonia phage Strosahl]YP_009624572.1 hypothetical protein FDJ48_gp053 [Gordonia phage Waits]ASZ7393